jgi:hypothetical protein
MLAAALSQAGAQDDAGTGRSMPVVVDGGDGFGNLKA